MEASARSYLLRALYVELGYTDGSLPAQPANPCTDRCCAALPPHSATPRLQADGLPQCALAPQVRSSVNTGTGSLAAPPSGVTSTSTDSAAGRILETPRDVI